MAILILTCKCGQQMKVPEAALGKTGTCVSCGKRLRMTKRNTSVFIDAAPRSATPPSLPSERSVTPPPLPVEPEAPLTDAQKVTQALTSRGVQTPPDWEELENLYAATEKAATRRSSRKKTAVYLTFVFAAVLCVIAFATGSPKVEPPKPTRQKPIMIQEPVTDQLTVPDVRPRPQAVQQQPYIPPQPQQAMPQAVYVTPTGKKYHKANCRTVSGQTAALSRQEAQARGYTACKVCGGV